MEKQPQGDKIIRWLLPLFFLFDFFARLELFGHTLYFTFRWIELLVSLLYLILFFTFWYFLRYEKRKKVWAGLFVYFAMGLGLYYLFWLLQFTPLGNTHHTAGLLVIYFLLHPYIPLSGLGYLFQNEGILMILSGCMATAALGYMVKRNEQISKKIGKGICTLMMLGYVVTVVFYVMEFVL